MSARPRPAPPSGQPPPVRAELGDGTVVDLEALAREVCDRYRAEYPDEEERYGEVGQQWCRHDNQHILAWAAGDVAGHVDFEKEIRWLAGVLGARGFPLPSLADDLEIAAEVVPELSEPLLGGAEIVRGL